MAESIVLWFPKPPDNANTKLHHMQMVRQKNAYKRELYVRTVAKLIPPPPAVPFLKSELEIAWHYPNRRHLLDDDNAIRRLKPVIDFLREGGYIAGDTSGHLRILPVETIIGAETPPCSTVRLTLTKIL
jgi:hypothetical protein